MAERDADGDVARHRVDRRGVGIGAVLAWSVTGGMSTLLYGVGAADPLTFAFVASLLGAVSAVAGAIPAVRAAGVDPMRALRDH